MIIFPLVERIFTLRHDGGRRHTPLAHLWCGKRFWGICMQISLLNISRRRSVRNVAHVEAVNYTSGTVADWSQR
jgi:hypothetical protein